MTEGGAALATFPPSPRKCGAVHVRPPVLVLNKIPHELRELPQWVLWRREGRGKAPYNPRRPHRPASVKDPFTWATFQEAVTAYQGHTFNGVGFVFTDGDPFAGIDVDKCRHGDTGEFDEWTKVLIQDLNSYTELSPSGMGVHILVKGKLPPGPRRNGRLEMYDTGRYFCMTGFHLAETPWAIEPRQHELVVLHERWLQPPESPAPPASCRFADHPATMPDERLLAKAMGAANGPKFSKLWQGEWGGYPSQSEADLALCGQLAFWTGGDEDRIDSLFRQSGLYRDKWDRQHRGDGRTYGELTVKKALHKRFGEREDSHAALY